MNKKSIIAGCGRMGRIYSSILESKSFLPQAYIDPFQTSFDNFNTTRDTLFFKDHSKLPADLTADIAIISSTADSHFTLAKEFILRNVPLIVIEKPLATSMHDCQKLINLASKHQTRVAVNHQMRFLPQYTIPKSLLNSPAYQGFSSMHIAAGNFGFAMNAVHYIEAFRFLSGDKPYKVSAWFDKDQLTNPRGTQFKDVSGCIRVETESGKRLYIDASSDQGHGVQATYMARNGRITIDELTGSMTTLVRQSNFSQDPTTRYGLPVDINHQQIPPVELFNSTASVIEALINGSNYPTLNEAALAVKTLVAAYHSHSNNSSEKLLDSISDIDPTTYPWA